MKNLKIKNTCYHVSTSIFEAKNKILDAIKELGAHDCAFIGDVDEDTADEIEQLFSAQIWNVRISRDCDNDGQEFDAPIFCVNIETKKYMGACGAIYSTPIYSSFMQLKELEKIAQQVKQLGRSKKQ